MSRAPVFLPLACPTCSGDLVGRAEDLLAFCIPCGRTFRCDGARLIELPSARVTLQPEGDGPLIHLPFWIDGGAAMPAFLTARPLTLARIAAARLERWPACRELGVPPPFGARIDPGCLSEVARLARVPQPGVRAPLALLAVPARVVGQRLHLPAFDGELYDDDVGDREDLLRLAASPSRVTRG